MELSKLLRGKIIFLDTAPLIYFIEKNARYLDVVKSVITLIDSQQSKGMTSTITLQHNLPHIHVEYQGMKAVIIIPDGALLEGQLPSKKLRLLQA